MQVCRNFGSHLIWISGRFSGVSACTRRIWHEIASCGYLANLVVAFYLSFSLTPKIPSSRFVCVGNQTSALNPNSEFISRLNSPLTALKLKSDKYVDGPSGNK